MVAAPVGAWQFEQTAEGTCHVGVLVGESEALALPPLLGLARRPVVLVLVRDLRKLRVGGGHRLAVLAELA